MKFTTKRPPQVVTGVDPAKPGADRTATMRMPQPAATAEPTEGGIDFAKRMKPKPGSLAAMLAKSQKAKTRTSGAADVLHGTGITKRATEQSVRKVAKQSITLASLLSKRPIAEPVSSPILKADLTALPSTMMDDDIQLDDDQAAAVAGIKSQQFACLIGKAGTGKTTTSKAVIAAIEATVPTIDLNSGRTDNDQDNNPDYNLAMCIVSFTGRAVQQIKRALPEEYHPLCGTIHATLGYSPTTEPFQDPVSKEWRERRVFRPTFDANEQLPYKVCVIDESGMVPIPLWNELLAALPSDCRVIMMGDINQLPPVQGRSVLGFAMTKWPTYTLHKLHRNAGAVAKNAHRILEGKLPLKDPAAFAMIELPAGGFETQNHIQSVVQALHKQGTFDPLRDALIVPQNVGPIGQEMLNGKLVHYFNPVRKVEGVPVNPRTSISAGFNHLTLAVGDKVMILANDRKRGLTNGMTGLVTEVSINPKYKGEQAANSFMNDIGSTSIDLGDLNAAITEQEELSKSEEAVKESERQGSHVTKVQFQNHDTPLSFATAGEYKKLSHAYAFTCHKSQGGEYPTVVIVCHSANAVMLTREWLYTAVTRAQQKVILLYNRRGLMQAVGRQTIKGITIEEKAASFLALQDKRDTSLPDLPEPCEVQT